MYTCPACGAEDVSNQPVCRCGADLSLLQRLDAVADAWFNRALEALADHHPGRALEWLSASCAARPTDVAARRAQAKVWAQLGRLSEARDSLGRARDIEPDEPELAEIESALQALESFGQEKSETTIVAIPVTQSHSTQNTRRGKKASGHKRANR
jgi:predicted Zn-dependent protease